MSSLAFTVYGQPVPQGSNRAIGNRVIASNGHVLKPWRQNVGSAAIEQAVLLEHDGFTGPVRVRATFTFRRPKSHYRTGKNATKLRDDAPLYPTARGCGDLDKLARAIGDALVDVSVLRDDDQIAEWRLAKRWCDADGALGVPGAVVEVHDLKAA
jgi:crossover junction endodeoxyribonuclease RusA